jgi:hypothetical protein
MSAPCLTIRRSLAGHYTYIVWVNGKIVYETRSETSAMLRLHVEVVEQSNAK